MASTAETETFKHEQLPNAATHIRLLEVTSVDDARGIKVHCKLTAWPKASAPRYAAISYTWGDPRLLATILVNGKSMEVRRNCEDVLRHPCGNRGGGYFWVDAVCINQTDSEEKGTQVAGMGAVFRDARQTLACVGRHGDDSEFLFERLHKHRLFWEWDPSGQFLMSNRRARLWRTLNGRSTIVRLYNALKMFLKRPYFHRAWIYQETFFGQDIEVCCGDGRVTLLQLRGQYLAFREPSVSSLEYLQNIDPEGYMETMKSVQSRLNDGFLPTTGKTLWQVVYETGKLQSEDIRDRVYGALAMINWHDRKPIQPDYGKDPFDLAVEVLLRMGSGTYTCIDQVLSNTITIARVLGLPDQPTSQLMEEIRNRTLMRSEASPLERTRVVREYESISSTFWGRRLHLDDVTWKIRSHPSTDDSEGPETEPQYPTIQKWSEENLWDPQNAGILLAQEAQPHDWVLLPFFEQHSSQSAYFAFIARDVGDSQLQLVGKALATRWEDWPTTQPFDDGGSQYNVYFDPEDAIALAYSCNWNFGPGGLLSEEGKLQKDQVDDYFATGLCGDKWLSYATLLEDQHAYR